MKQMFKQEKEKWGFAVTSSSKHKYSPYAQFGIGELLGQVSAPKSVISAKAKHSSHRRRDIQKGHCIMPELHRWD
jgi:hypothetical protein